MLYQHHTSANQMVVLGALQANARAATYPSSATSSSEA